MLGPPGGNRFCIAWFEVRRGMLGAWVKAGGGGGEGVKAKPGSTLWVLQSGGELLLLKSECRAVQNCCVDQAQKERQADCPWKV